MALPDPPDSMKSITMFLKCATEHDTRDPVVAYYCRLCAFQKGFGIDASSQAAKSFLNKLMSHLEASKKQLATNECITSETLGLAHVESYALKLFNFACQRDLNADFGRATVKSFYTAGVLLDVATTLGNPNDELEKARKYAKWKAVYIIQCQKNGETPVAGPAAANENDDLPTRATTALLIAIS
ncbi:unnamed protein product [Echinostoma caproni]|uniref:Vta1 domain-containing protein n=1 Tax=Echinostoma caproni TaxID=27848 RepID=A0A183AWD2_9TREM|nr:unnamed protein product [Echinostoma caproni]